VLGYLASVPQAEQASVLLVSHNPLVSELLAVLTDTDHANLHIINTSELNVLAVDVPARGLGTLLYRLQS
jgi:phosphohistidine phosphatase SixA